MKKNVLATAVGIAAVAVAAVGCSSASSGSGASATQSTGTSQSAQLASGSSGKVIYNGSGTVAFAVYNGAVYRWLNIDAPNIKHDLAIYAPHVNFVVKDAQGSAATQLSEVQSLILGGAKMIVLTPAQADPSTLIAKTQAAHVPVTVLEGLFTGLNSGQVVALASPSPYALGEAQAQWTIQHTPKGGTIGLIDGDLGQQWAILQRQGFLHVIDSDVKSGIYHLVGDKSTPDFSPVNAQAEAAAVLTAAHNNITTFVAGNDDVATGIIQALGHAGLAKKITVVGMGAEVDGAQNILQGTQAVTIGWSVAQEDEESAQIVAYTLAGKSIPKSIENATYNDGVANFPFAQASINLITKDNLSLGIQLGDFTSSQICKGLPASVGAPC
jgi:D-xylose transport system substrate-binding protein